MFENRWSALLRMSVRDILGEAYMCSMLPLSPWLHLPMHAYVEARAGLGVSASLTLCVVALRQGLSEAQCLG